MEMWTNKTSDQNTTVANNIMILKAQDAAYGAMEDERFALILLHESRLFREVLVLEARNL